MYICSNCKQTFENPINFCPSCGSAVVEETPVVEPTPYIPPMQTYSAPSLGKVITGMALSIAGLFFAGIGFIYTLIFLALDGAMAFGMSFGFMIFSLPLALIGMIMSNKNIAAGSTNKMAKLGKTFGLIGIIATGVMFFFGLIALATY